MDRIDEERSFHDALAAQGMAPRCLANVLASGFYEKDIVWSRVWDTVGDLAEKRVLDLGCGDGGFVIPLAQRGARAYGIDISAGSIAMAKEQHRGVAGHFSVQDAHCIAFVDDAFDFVFGNGILHHLDLPRCYAEISRILRPGGHAFFMEPLHHHPLLRLFRRLTPGARTTHERPLSMSDIEIAMPYFCEVDHHEYFLLAVIAAPLHLVGRRIAKRLIALLHRIDQVIFRLLPFTRRYAWITLIHLKKVDGSPVQRVERPPHRPG